MGSNKRFSAASGAKQTLSAHEGQLRTTEVLHSANKRFFSNSENDQKRNQFGTVWLPDYSACGHTSLSVEFVAFMRGCDAIFERGGTVRRAGLLTARKQPDTRSFRAGNDQHAIRSSTREENDGYLA